jgi:hypothetical protein
MHLNFLAASNLVATHLSKNVSSAYIVSARFGKQHINLVNPIIDFTSFFIACALTNARNRHFGAPATFQPCRLVQPGTTSWSSTRLDGLYSCVTVLTPFPAGVQLPSVAAVALPWYGLPGGQS